MQHLTFDIPILLITFNRPDTTVKVLKRILECKPAKLFVFSDGPRSEKDVTLIEETRLLFADEQIKNNCELNIWFSDKNLGCGIGPSSAISWAFQNCEKLIILEDDCLPNLTFFSYCKVMLDRYEAHDSVMHVAGTRWNPEFNTGSGDHFFSKIGHIWGWATWKRAWHNYDYSLTRLNELLHDPQFFRRFKDPEAVRHWVNGFTSVKSPENTSVWDYQWQFALFLNQGLSVVPKVNLVTNVGINGIHYTGDLSTHLFQKSFEWTSDGNEASENITANELFDDYHMYHRFLKKSPLYMRVLNRARRLLKS